MVKLPNLTETETRNCDALFRAMGDRHLTADQRRGLAEMIKAILDEAAARG